MSDTTNLCFNCHAPITLADDGAWEDASGACGCGDGEHEPSGCMWLIQVASGNPEPDFPEDLWRTIECGAAVTFNEHGSWTCAHGHSYTTYDDPDRASYEAEMAFMERQEG